MFEHLRQAFETGNVDLGIGGFVLVSETEVSGSGLLTHFLSWASSVDIPVCFVAVQNTFTHYSHACSQIGLNLNLMKEKNALKVIDCLKFALDAMRCSESVTENSDINPFNFVENEYLGNLLFKLFRVVKENVDDWLQSEKPFIIVIDNISVFLTLGIKVEDILTFSHYCLTLVQSVERQVDKPNGSVIVLSSCNECDEDSMRVTNALAYKSFLNIEVKKFKTGLMKNIHGVLNIYSKNNEYCCKVDAMNYQFRMEEKGLTLLHPGTETSIF